MEKRGDVATNRINTCEVCPLVSITQRANILPITLSDIDPPPRIP
jgi:hypothetical protein